MTDVHTHGYVHHGEIHKRRGGNYCRLVFWKISEVINLTRPALVLLK